MKRIFDIIFALIGMALITPILAVVSVAVFLNLGRPIFFIQERPGLRGEPFKIIKFRTMRDARDSAGNELPDCERLTKFGAFLRSSSVDELPELWNVLKGEMSFVGPRPLLMEYLPLYSARQARRHEVRPGITGWAQVNGRNALDWNDRLELDVWYVDNRSMLLDMKILLLTIGRVISRKGVTAEGSVTVEKFKG